MYDILLDESGAIRENAFYILEPWDKDQEEFPEPEYSSGWIVSSLPDYPGWAEIVYEKRKVVRKCLQCARPLQRRLVSVECDLFYKLNYDSFVPVRPLPTSLIVVRPFASKLRRSGLKGLDLVKVEIVTPPDLGTFTPTDIELYALAFLGRISLRQWRFAPGVRNACPFCGHEPLKCPGCGSMKSPCPQCGEMPVVAADSHKGPGDRRLRVAPRPKAGPVLEGKHWDGSDFISGSIITKRARDWLLSVHAAPIAIGPARVCIDGMSPEQLRWLEEAQKPLPSQAQPEK